MNNNLHIEIVLDDLLKNKISASEASAILEKENVADTAFEIELHFAAAKAIQRYNMLKQVQLVHRDYADSNNKTTAVKKMKDQNSRVIAMMPLKRAIRIAASVILLIGIWFTYQYVSTSSSKLYSEVYQPYNINTSRGVADITTHNMVEEFKKKDYTAVIKTYESLSAANNRENFLAAYAYHETGNYTKAAEVLQQILAYNKQTNNRLYNDEAEFYLALSYLKMKDVKSAIPIFEGIQQNPNHTFHERVSKWMVTKLKWIQ